MACAIHATSKALEPSYQKRVRHKMRDDPVSASVGPSKTSRRAGQGISRTASRPKAKRVKGVKGMVESSTIDGKGTRLTVILPDKPVPTYTGLIFVVEAIENTS